MTEPRKVSFGFLLVPLQLLDMCGPMDVLNNVATPFVTMYGKWGLAGNEPERLVSSSLDITYHHIGPTMDPVHVSGGALIQPTCTVDDCPKLDYLLVGGPDPRYAIEPGQMPESMKEFVRQRSQECNNVFATCTGAFVLASAGVLDGKRATVNHMCVKMGVQAFPAVKWAGDKNWVVSDDGKFWTAGGACAGMDMMAEFVRREVGEEVFALCTEALEYQPRDVDGRMLSFTNGRGEKITVDNRVQYGTVNEISAKPVGYGQEKVHTKVETTSYEL